ncbi:MAG: glycosyltransferase family 4 protein [Candidatus Roizmanbacteria bacterium]|nr:glycosyltransferase family 4 protein [Candidatus Roizmanbacteria bacterium]
MPVNVSILEISDQSIVRGVGRYTQLLTQALEGHTTERSTLINPFVNPILWPTLWMRHATRQIGVLHDTIPITYPHHFPIGMRGHLNVLLHRNYILGLYDGLVTHTQTSRRAIVRFFNPACPITVIYPGVAPLGASQKLSRALPSPYLLYIGDITWNKNIVVMARAVLKAGIPMVLVGKAIAKPPHPTDPWQEDFRTFSALTQDASRFIKTGFVPDAQVRWLYEHALANVLVSRDEGFGLSYIEAGSVGTPSILSDIPVFHEIAGDAAVFVNHNDPDSIAAAIARFARDPSLRKKMGDAAKERSSFFSIHRFTSEFRALLP